MLCPLWFRPYSVAQFLLLILRQVPDAVVVLGNSANLSSWVFFRFVLGNGQPEAKRDCCVMMVYRSRCPIVPCSCRFEFGFEFRGRYGFCSPTVKLPFKHFEASDVIGGAAVTGLYIRVGIVGNLV